MRFSGYLAAILFCCAPLYAEDLSCKSETEFDDGSSSGVEVKLQLEKDRVINISYSNFNSNGEEGGAYFCSFEAALNDQESIWTQDKSGQRVHLLEGADPKSANDDEQGSTFEIVKTKTGYSINFIHMSRFYCGFGAEYPSSVSIEKGKKECVVSE